MDCPLFFWYPQPEIPVILARESDGALSQITDCNPKNTEREKETCRVPPKSSVCSPDIIQQFVVFPPKLVVCALKLPPSQVHIILCTPPSRMIRHKSFSVGTTLVGRADTPVQCISN